MISANLARFLRQEFRLEWRGIHGVPHWARVRVNGLQLAAATGANPTIVELFAFLHDARRENDGRDREHGVRAARLASELNGSFFTLTKDEFQLLDQACREHSDGRLDGDITVQTCWDADRLDLGRIGTRPDPRRLCTEAARRPEVIARAFQRSRCWR